MSTGASGQDVTYTPQKIISIAGTQHNKIFCKQQKTNEFLKTLTVTPLVYIKKRGEVCLQALVRITCARLIVDVNIGAVEQTLVSVRLKSLCCRSASTLIVFLALRTTWISQRGWSRNKVSSVYLPR